MKIYLNENSKENKVNQKLGSLTKKGIDQTTIHEIFIQALKFIDILNDSAQKGMSTQLDKTFRISKHDSITIKAQTRKQQSFIKRLKSI